MEESWTLRRPVVRPGAWRLDHVRHEIRPFGSHRFVESDESVAVLWKEEFGADIVLIDMSAFGWTVRRMACPVCHAPLGFTSPPPADTTRDEVAALVTCPECNASARVVPDGLYDRLQSASVHGMLGVVLLASCWFNLKQRIGGDLAPLNLIFGLLGLGLFGAAFLEFSHPKVTLVPLNLDPSEPIRPERKSVIVRGKESAHGEYGSDADPIDWRGVVFFRPSVDGLSEEVLAVGDSYVSSLFGGILDRVWNGSGGGQVPRLVMEWNCGEGWASGCQPKLIPAADAADLAAALALLGPTELGQHGSGDGDVEKCLRCAAVIREFLVNRVEDGRDLFIKND